MPLRQRRVAPTREKSSHRSKRPCVPGTATPRPTTMSRSLWCGLPDVCILHSHNFPSPRQEGITPMSESVVAAATSKIVRVGILSAIGKIDPREAVDNISGMILGQVFEAPYAIAAGQTNVT